jgi:hypothetical protein
MRFIIASLCAGCIAFKGADCLAQVRARMGSPSDNQNQSGMGAQPVFAPSPGLGGVPAAAPRPMSGLGGVPSAAPRPMSGLGGVRASGPGPIPIDQSPHQPQYQPMPVGPWPGVVVSPQSASGSTMPARISGGEGFVGGRTFLDNSIGGSFSSDGGLLLNGSYAGDRLRLAFHLGSDAFSRPFHHNHGYPIVFTYPTYWGYPGWWYDDYRSYFGYRYGNIYGNGYTPEPTTYVPPTPPQAETPVPSTSRELGDTYLRAGDPRAAVHAYEAHLKQYPGDEDAMRALGVALIDNGQTTEGVAMVAMAYKSEPLLADRPVSRDLFRGDALARDLARASIYANRSRSSSGWLTVAVYMQAQGRDDLARTMVERARAAGLETAVVDRLTAALR